MDPRLLRAYETELAFVREVGGEFAREFPKIAARLSLGSLEVADPYVERLLEGFALLTARMQLKMEAEFPTFTQSLLQMVYPHYLGADPVDGGGAVPPEQTLARHAEGRRAAGRHGSAQPARHRGPDQLRVPHRACGAVAADRTGGRRATSPRRPRLRRSGCRSSAASRRRSGCGCATNGEAPLAKLALERLPLFLAGAEGARVRLYEQLIANLAAIYVRPTERPLPWQERLPAGALRPLGFAPEEALLPRAPQSFDGYRLLQEYYAMPERFLFVELGGLERAGCAQQPARSWKSCCC